MQEMTIKIVANFVHNGKREELTEEAQHIINDPPLKKDTAELSNLIKKHFEEELNRTAIVKVRINKESILAKVQIRPNQEEEEGIEQLSITQ